MTYVDKNGNKVDQSFEQKKPLLKFFFVINIIIPFVLLIMIIIKTVINNNCKNVYEYINKASLKYATDQEELPEIEGESININVGSLYSEQYLKSTSTNDLLCSGNVKITKYKDKYIYTLDIKNCDKCSTNKKYKRWSNFQNNYPSGKSIVDVKAYYNYYDRDLSTTKWSRFFENDELSDKKSKYNNYLPIDMDELPETPSDVNIFNIENEEVNYYRYKDRSWKWYDIVGNYSDFSSEKPNGFENKDENTEKYTEWSKYTTNYPEELSYRDIEQTTGYKFYYVNSKNKKIYYNKGKLTAKEEVNTDKYNKTENETATLYRYRDKVWRWYNGQKRRYSYFKSNLPDGYTYKDEGLEQLSSPTSWSQERRISESNANYRLEETKIMTRFRIKYEIISLKALETPLEKTAFENEVGESLEDFNSREDKKLEVTYKFRYKK